MNGQDYKNAFGKAPESFKSRVTFTLSHVKEEQRMKRFSIRLVLIAGIILVLMAGVVYAASTEWKLFDFFSGSYGREPASGLQTALEKNNIRKVFEAEGYVISLQEAIADGRYFYITANVRLQSGEEVYFLPLDTTPDDPVFRTAPRSDGQQGTGDTRTFWQAAQQDGKRMIRIDLWARIGAMINEMSDFSLLPDGSVTFVLGGTLFTEEKTLDVELTFSEQEVLEGGEQNKKGGDVRKSKNAFRFTLPVAPATEARSFPAGKVPVEGAGILVDKVELILTPLTMHYQIHFTAEESLAENQDMGFRFDFVDGDGNEIAHGLTIRRTMCIMCKRDPC